MLDFIIFLFAILGVLFAVVFLISRFKKISMEDALAIVWKWVLENLRDNDVTYFQLNADGFDKILDIVTKHSRISKENTLCENRGIHVWFQLLPVNERSLAAAGQEVKIYIRNAATVAGYVIDVDAWDVPGADGTRILHFDIATTDEQKSELAAMRQNRARMEVLQAGASMKPYTDGELEEDMKKMKKDGAEDGSEDDAGL